jgi:hypothetical protein
MFINSIPRVAVHAWNAVCHRHPARGGAHALQVDRCQ